MHKRTHKDRDGLADDVPIYSTLFIVADSMVTEEAITTAFKPFGTIENIVMPIDSQTEKVKGIVFVKFSKTSEAANALEALHLKAISSSSKPIKVMVAKKLCDLASESNTNKYKTLFITMQQADDQKKIESVFSQYGHIETIFTEKDSNSGESKEFAYITYSKFSEAARAYEECEKKYRAIFRAPKNNMGNALKDQSTLTVLSTINTSTFRTCSLIYKCSPQLSQVEVRKIFDLTSGLVSFEYVVDALKNVSKGKVIYSNPMTAACALKRLNCYEYPPDIVLYLEPGDNMNDLDDVYFIPSISTYFVNPAYMHPDTHTPEMTRLGQTIKKLLQLTLGDRSMLTNNLNHLKYCRNLPAPKPLVNINSPVAKSCSIICKPQCPPIIILRDIFCRFGNLIAVDTLSNKSVVYATYASVESADKAIRALNGTEVFGVRMKVVDAHNDPFAKRQRLDS